MSPLCASRLNSAIANPPPVFPGSPAGCICTHHLPAHSLALSLLPAPSSAVPGPILLCCTSLSLHVLAWLTETSSPGLSEVEAGGCIYTSSGNRSPAPAPRVSSTIVSTSLKRMACCPGVLSHHSICGLPGAVWLGWADPHLVA